MNGQARWPSGFLPPVSRAHVPLPPTYITKQVEPTRARAIEAYTSGRAGVRLTRTTFGPPSTVLLSTSYRPYMKLFNFSRPALRALTFGAAALVMTSTAFAHAHLVSSEPAAN